MISQRYNQVIASLRKRTRQLKADTYALYLAYRDPRVSWGVRLFAACVVAYAFSPIDLVPDFIPVLGYLDDLILVPLGIYVAVRLIPPQVMEECRVRAHERLDSGKPISRAAAVVIVLIWIGLAALGIVFMARLIDARR